MLNYHLDIAPESKWIITTKSEAARAMPFYLTELGDFFAGSGYFTERDQKEGYQLIYTISGRGLFQTKTQELLLTPGSVLIIKGCDHHRYETDQAVWHNRWIHFGGAGADAYEAYINDGKYVLAELSQGDRTADTFRTLTTLAPRNDLISCAQISNCISDLLTTVLTHRLSALLQPHHAPAHYPDIRRAVEYIHQNFQQPISIEDMTALVNISKYHFIRIFKKQMGTTPYEYLVSCRMNQAKILLRSTDDTLDHIAAAVGYQSKSNFIAQFKAITGQTPARYRAESIRF